MKISLTYILILILFSSCLVPENKPVDFLNQYYSGNEGKFGFIILDKASCDSFIDEFAPLDFNNTTLRNEIDDALLDLKFETEVDSSIPKTLINYSNNTISPDTNSFSLAMNVIESMRQSKKPEHFGACLEYLFYYRCLPAEIKHKWHQTTLGDFEFNTTFFNRMRLCNKGFDEMCFGDRWNHDPKLSPIFSIYPYNEISVTDATSLKNTIETNKAFDEIRFSNDKAIFLAILNQVIANQWRLIMIDTD